MCPAGVPIEFLLTTAIPKSPSQKSAQLSDTAEIANQVDSLNIVHTPPRKQIRVINPDNPMNASSKMNPIDL